MYVIGDKNQVLSSHLDVVMCACESTCIVSCQRQDAVAQRLLIQVVRTQSPVCVHVSDLMRFCLHLDGNVNVVH